MTTEDTQHADAGRHERGVRRWDRRLWGVLFYGSDRRDKPMLIGAMWHKERRTFAHAYAGEPARALLFCTRREARAWCKQRHDEWAAGDEIVSKWRVRAVPVRETVAVEAPNVLVSRQGGADDA